MHFTISNTFLLLVHLHTMHSEMSKQKGKRVARKKDNIQIFQLKI